MIIFCYCILAFWPSCSQALTVQDSGQLTSLVDLEVDPEQDLIDFHQNKTYHDLKAAKGLQNITCPELGNFTFSNEAPFDILGLPQCGDKVEPELRLYMDDANKTECILDAKNLPNANTTHCFQILRDHVETRKLVILTHGFLNNFDTVWLHTMKDAILEAENGTAVIVSRAQRA